MNPVRNAAKQTNKGSVDAKVSKKSVSNGMKTYSAKPTEVERKWYVIDASEVALGRMATEIAQLLTGKKKPMFTAHIDCGDFVVVINADKIKVTGGKEEKKIYYRHTKYPGGIKETMLKDMDPVKVVEKAVYGMVPANKLRADRMKRLKVYTGSDHQHDAQKPTKLSLKGNK